MTRIPFKQTCAILLLSVGLVVFLDQYTKYIVVETIRQGTVVPVIDGVFNLTLTYNKGAAFGMLSGVSDGLRQLLLGGVTALAVCVVLYFLFYDYYHDRFAQMALGFILGGAAGNVLDRIRIGEVVDFLDVYYRNYHWPAFNVADSAICIGVVFLLFRSPAKRKDLPVTEQ